MNLLQSSFPLDPEPFALVASEAEMELDDVLARTRRLLDERIIREITPIFDTRALGYESMLVAAKVDAENPQRAAAIVNSHPGVSHNYLRTHDFNLWFTIATPPDSELGLAGTLEVLMRETGAESMRQLPTLTLFKINMNLEMEKGTDALAAAVDAAPPRELEAQPYDERDIAVIRALQGPMDAGRAALRRGRRRARDDDRGAARAPARDGRPQAAAPRRGDPLPPPRRLLGQRDGRLEGARGRDHGDRPAAWPPSAASPTATSAPPTRTGPTASSPWPTAARRRSATRSSTRSPRSAGWAPTTAPPSTPRPSTRRSASTTSPTSTRAWEEAHA